MTMPLTRLGLVSEDLERDVMALTPDQQAEYARGVARLAAQRTGVDTIPAVAAVLAAPGTATTEQIDALQATVEDLDVIGFDLDDAGEADAYGVAFNRARAANAVLDLVVDFEDETIATSVSYEAYNALDDTEPLADLVRMAQGG